MKLDTQASIVGSSSAPHHLAYGHPVAKDNQRKLLKTVFLDLNHKQKAEMRLKA